MANRLQKKTVVAYTPGTPYVPATPGYCVATVSTSSVAVAGGSATVDSVVDLFTDDDGELHIWQNGPLVIGAPKLTTKKVCYPGTPAIPATPGRTTVSTVTGWNAGGRSIVPMINDGAFRFQVSQGAVGAVVGLVARDASTQYNEATHAFHVHGGVVDVVESGVTVATAPTAHVYASPMEITRAGDRAFYTYDGWVYESATPITRDPVYLDAALYLSGDYVDNPALLPGVAYGTGELAGALQALATFMTDAESYAYLTGQLEALAGALTGTSGRTGALAGVLPPLAALLTDRASYGQLAGALPPLVADLTGGFPVTSVGYLVGALPPPAAHLRGFTGGNGQLAGSLPALTALLTDRADYGQMVGGLPAKRGWMLQRTPVDYGRADNSLLVLADVYRATVRQRARIDDALRLSDSWTLRVSISGMLFDALSLSSSATAYRVLRAVAQSGLLLAGSSGTSAAAVQYAVNVLTGALTTYSGFDFGGFALANDTVYACRPDGLYRLRPGDDDGSPISVSVDFGTTDYGSVKAKTVQDVFLGLTTDGEVVVTLRTDGTERSYLATARGPMMRATAARGAIGRRWNLVLEVSEATEFELDTVEHVIGVTTRRGIR